MTPPFKLKSKLTSQFFDSLDKHEKLVFDKINSYANKQSDNSLKILENKSLEIVSAGVPKHKSGLFRNSNFKIAMEKDLSKSPVLARNSFAEGSMTPNLEKRQLMSPGIKTSPLKALFPTLFKNDSSSPSHDGRGVNGSSVNSSLSSPTTVSPMLRGMSALLKKPALNTGDESKVLMKILK